MGPRTKRSDGGPRRVEGRFHLSLFRGLGRFRSISRSTGRESGSTGRLESPTPSGAPSTGPFRDTLQDNWSGMDGARGGRGGVCPPKGGPRQLVEI